MFKLFQAGANDIVREMFDGSLRAGRYVLENMGLTEYEAAQAEADLLPPRPRRCRELALLWREDMPTAENAEQTLYRQSDGAWRPSYKKPS